MKIGSVPLSVVTQSPYLRLDPRHYLGATETEVDKERAKVRAERARLARAEKALAKVERSFAEGAVPGVTVIK